MARLRLLTWEEVVGYVYELARSISESGYRPEVIVAAGREGLAAARLLSEFLGVAEVALPGAVLEGRRVLVAVDNSRYLTREKLEAVEAGRPAEVKTAAVVGAGVDYSGLKPEEGVEYILPWETVEAAKRLALEAMREAAGGGKRLWTIDELIAEVEKRSGVKLDYVSVKRALDLLEEEGIVEPKDGTWYYTG